MAAAAAAKKCPRSLNGRGRVLSPIELQKILDSFYGGGVRLREHHLRSFSRREILMRELAHLKAAAASTENVMLPILEAVRVYATLGELCDTLREVWGEYVEVPVI